MTTAERIVIGLASLIALIGWLRGVGTAVSHDHGLRNQHPYPASPPKYQRPSSEPSEANRQIDNDIANLTPVTHRRVIDVNQTNYENAKLTELLSSRRRE